jgi:hypothetical protein
MEIKRKVQLGALAVIANATLGLTMFYATPALANPCTEQFYCAGLCPANLNTCNSIAPAGCTATSDQCLSAGTACGGLPILVGCLYQ